MTPEKQRELNQHLQAIAEILYGEAEPTKVADLAGIEETIRKQTARIYNTTNGFFFIKKTTGTEAGRIRTIKSIIGEIPITEKQAIRLKVKNNQKISPYLEQCCVRASANVSYKDAARDIQYYTGMKISERTQQRIVHRYEFPLEESLETLEEMSLDGGKVRLRTEKKGEGSHWKDNPRNLH
jgi:hypothetical protein